MSRSLAPPTGRVGLSWLVTVRWASVAAGIAAVGVGERALGISPPLGVAAGLVGATAASNLWLAWRSRQSPPLGMTAAGLLVSADVLVLLALLVLSGGVANAVSIFFVVHIVLAALVLGREWTWGITTLTVAGYGVLFLALPSDMTAAQAMHPTIDRHITGMWWAFAATATIVALLVGRLASAVARRDAELALMREDANRSERLAGLATLAAGAAHELSTPLGTIAVTARELELSLDRLDAGDDVRADVTLIRSELGRCRAVLDDLAATTGRLAGEMPTTITAGAFAERIAARLAPADRERLRFLVPDLAAELVWPADAVARALTNLVHNGLQASTPPAPVVVEIGATDSGSVNVSIVDEGHGVSEADLKRVGQPFFTTKAEGAGMGLGVFVARSTVKLLGGTFTFHSTIGRGSRVQIVLPLRIDPATAAHMESGA